MIRINLLPVPKARKSEALLMQGVAGVMILGVVALGCYFLGTAKESEIALINRQIGEKQQAINELKAKVGEVERYKQQMKTLEDQLSVIRALEAGRSGPVKMMDELTDLVPRKLWINTFRETGKKVNIEGIAESGPVIADFLDNLKSSKYFSAPELVVVSGIEMEGQRLHKFTITMGVKYDI